MVVEANKKKNYDVYCLMQFVSFLLSSVAITVTYLVINDLINVWLGEKFVLEPLISLAIALNMYFSVVLMPIWSYREATGMYLQTKYVMVATAVVNLMVSILLGKILGLAGILFATSIARISTYFWYEPRLLFKQFFGENVWNYYKGILKNIVVTFIVTVICSLVFQKFVVMSWGDFFIKAVGVSICALILTIVLYCKDPSFRVIMSMTTGLLKRV